MRRILLVDDDAESHSALARECLGFARVLHAMTGATASRVIDEHTIHLVVLEHRLSDRSGLELLASIKARQPWLPIIVSTAYGSERVCASALKLGARDYFIKPWAPSEIGNSIRAILATADRRGETRRNVLTQRRPLPAVRPSRDGSEQAIRDAARLISEQPSDMRSFSELARDLGLSKSALSRRFRRTLNVSYRRFVLESRISRARQLLMASNLTITEISQLVGFSDLPRFDKVFKAAVGTSPSLYRQQETSPKATSY